MTKPLVSVIIPAYNVEGYIEKTIESVLNQTYRNLEIIVVNDGSTDKTREIAYSILRNSGVNFKIIDQTNQGVSVARNIGIENASGDYIKFLDGDDRLPPNSIELLLSKALEKNIGIVFGGQDVITFNGKVIYKYEDMYKFKWETESYKRAIIDFLTGEIYISVNNSLISSKLIKENDIKFTKGAKYGEDNEFLTKVIYYSKSIYYLGITTALLVYRPTSSTKKPTLSTFHNVGSVKRLIKFFKNLSETEIVKVLENYSLPSAYGWSIANLAFNGYPYKKWIKLAKNKHILEHVKKMKIPNRKKTKFQKQALILKHIYLTCPSILYFILRISSKYFSNKAGR